jgi:hypothetical protein
LSLRSICIPSSIETISASCFRICQLSVNCFRTCQSLLSVRFEPNCRVSTLGTFVFAYCLSLQSICIPPAITVIPKNCLHGLQGSLEFDIRAVLEGFDPWRISIFLLRITSIDLHSFIRPDDF